MGRRKRNYPVLERVQMEDGLAEGKALARIDGMILFVKGAVPGDIADVQVTKKKSRYWEGYPVHYHHYSEKRIEAVCQHFGTCGGCKWQHLSYEDQLHYKHTQVIDSLERIGGLELPEVPAIIGSKATEFYRNKLEFSASDRKWLTDEEIKDPDLVIEHRSGLGFHLPGRFDRILDIDQCHLQAEPSNSIRLAVRSYLQENDLPFFNIRGNEGFFRNMVVRTTSTGEVMVILIVFDDRPELLQLLQHLEQKFPEITSLMYVINQKLNDSWSDLEVIPHAGKDHLIEELDGLKFKIGPKSFFQTNSQQATVLYQIARDFADLQGEELVYDLYTGTGTIANYVAQKAAKVIGVEFIPEAIEDAKVNAQLNGIENTLFFAGDTRKTLSPEFVAEHGAPDVIITDPPRVGMHEDVVNTILGLAPQKVVYISCHPGTQARDLALMADAYHITKVQPVDMFPHTTHVENVVLLERKEA